MQSGTWSVNRLWSTAVAAVVFLVPAGAALAGGEWRVVNDDEWCRSHPFGSHCEVREITIPAGRDVIEVSCANGAIEVEGWDRDEIFIRAKIAARNEDVFDEIEILTDHRIHARGPKTGFMGWFGGRKWSVSYRIKVPQRSNLDAHTTNGGLMVTDVSGDLDLGSTNGGVKLYRVGGNVEGGTTNGGISVVLEGVTWDGDGLDLHTTNGGITVMMPDGYSARLEAHTTNGSVKVDHPIRIDQKSRNRLEGTIGDGGALIRARTTNGGVRFRESG